MFNNPESACRTCGGLGVDKLTHPDLLVPDPDRSILGGCFVREAFKYNPDTWDGRLMFSLSKALNFPLDSPVEDAAGVRASGVLYGFGRRRSGGVAAGREGAARAIRMVARSAFTALPGESSGTTAATASAARRTRGWRSGSTR